MPECFDISAYLDSQLDTAVVRILDPVSGEKLNIEITVASPDSEVYRKASMRVQNEQLQFAMKNRGKTTAERLAENSLEILVGATIGWKGIAEKGTPLPCTPDNVRRVYKMLPFIREQVDEFLGDRRNFLSN